MAEKYYVKCEDCGRRLPGPARRCDVCGGKMTSSAEGSYFTPEGVVSKKRHAKIARKTPDGNVKKGRTKTSASKANNKPRNSKTNADSNPMIDRVGDAVDILAGDDELTVESFKKIGKALKGEKPVWSPINRTGSGNKEYIDDNTNDQHEYKENRNNLIKKYAGGFIVFLIIMITFAIGSADDSDYYDDGYYDDGTYYDEDGAGYSEALYPDETVSGDGYDLTLDEIGFEHADGESEYFYAFLTVNVTGNSDIAIKPYTSFAAEFDGKAAGELDFINIYNDDTYEDKTFYNDIDGMVFESGYSYIVTICYTKVPAWNDLNLIHAFSGDISEHNTELDIPASREGISDDDSI